MGSADITNVPQQCKMLMKGELEEVEEGLYGNSVFSPQFFCDPKTTLKIIS